MRTVDLLLQVSFVVHQIYTSASPIILTGTVDCCRIIETTDVFFQRFRGKDFGGIFDTLKAGANEVVGIGADDSFREIVGLNEEKQ